MTYREHLPCPALRRHVACFWTMTTAHPTTPVRVLPDGCADILLDFTASTARIIGVMTRSVLAMDDRIDLLGVRFHPGEAFAFLALRGDEGRDQSIRLDDVWGAAGRSLAARLADCSESARVPALEAELLGRLARVRVPDPRLRKAIAMLRGDEGQRSVSQVGAAVGLGERQIERLFLERVGVGPKALSRVFRLQAFVARLDAAAPRAARRRFGLGDLAADLGYADQAHLVREVRALVGVTPTELARERAMSVSSNLEAASRTTVALERDEDSPCFFRT